MYHTYFFIGKVSESLGSKLTNWRVCECFSQNKDELIIGLSDGRENFFLKCNMNPEVCIISFSEDYRRARKNSVDLFAEAIGKQVLAVRQVDYDRSFYFRLSDDSALIFKLHGRRSNVFHLKGGTVRDIFRKNLRTDRDIKLKDLGKTINLKEPGAEDYKTLRLLFPKQRVELPEDNRMVLSLTRQFLEASIYYISLDSDSRPWLSFTKPAAVLYECRDPLEASNQLAFFYTKHYFFEREKQLARNFLNKKLKQSDNYLKKSKKELEDLKNRRSLEELANILMANLHRIEKGAEEVSLYDFYRDGHLKMKLKPGTTPQQHAENLYRKAKNEKIQIEKTEDNIRRKQAETEKLKSLTEVLDGLQTRKALKRFVENHLPGSAPKASPHLPYHEFSASGFRIWVGKNAAANDELTLKHAHKNDVWLHARDVPGSHVLIKTASDKKLPGSVLEKAAATAAYFSKRKTDTLCPVIYTPRKYVRKKKGAPPGSVVVEREEVLMVKPEKP